jgi:hypothetical protein
MKTQANFSRSIIGVAVVIGLILMVPFVSMQFTDEVKWGPVDFIIMGALIFGTGLSYKLVTRSATSVIYKIAMALALGSALFMVWANLAVGLIGSGPNPGNLMYIGVLMVIIIGTILSGLKAGGMERAMVATIISLVLLAIIALASGMHQYPDSSVNDILAVNGLFAALFFVAGLLFHQAAREPSPAS